VVLTKHFPTGAMWRRSGNTGLNFVLVEQYTMHGSLKVDNDDHDIHNQANWSCLFWGGEDGFYPTPTVAWSSL